METDEGAANYMLSYNEGPGSDIRHMIGALINDGETVLDVGCGPGWNLDHFLEFGPNIKGYYGLDYSERFVRVANQRHSYSPELFKRFAMTPDDPMFGLGDVRKLEQPDLSWDVVILQDVLEHTNGYEGPVKEALRVARKRVIITFWRLSSGEEDIINDDGNDGYGAAYSKKKWEKFLNTNPYPWMDAETPEGSNRHHNLYVIEKVDGSNS